MFSLVNSAAYDIRLPYSSVTLARIAQPRREDMVFAELPTHVRAFKRVIGLPGETIEGRDNRMIINGRALPMTPLNSAEFSWVPAQHHMGRMVVIEDGHLCAYTPGANKDLDFGPLHLGARQYFVMGDNRDVSLDSRAFGPIERGKILGRMIGVIPRTKRQTGRN